MGFNSGFKGLNMKGTILLQPCYFADACFLFCVVLNNAAMLRDATLLCTQGRLQGYYGFVLEFGKTAKMVLLAFGTNCCNDRKVLIAGTHRHDGAKTYTPVFP